MQSYKNVVQDKAGNVLPGSTITVYAAGTTTLSTIYSDNSSTALTNPFTTSATGDGTFEFWAADGRYDVKTVNGTTTVTKSGIVLYDAVGSSTTELELFAGTTSAVKYTENSSHVLHDKELHAGLTASTTQTQGNGVLLSSHNEISTVANTNDTVTLPSAAAGRICEIINKGANTLQIFPASGDDLGAGTDTATTLESNGVVAFRAYDSTNWHVSAATVLYHAQIFDQDNTDAFVVNDAGGDFHAYHTNGIASSDLSGWTFDIGGGGTSFPIASIADAGSGDITVTTTGSHTLAVGAVISQTNLADAAYVGVFKVKTVPTATTYTVTAVYTATGTGTMDEASTLTCLAIAAGAYDVHWVGSATSASNNETFDFQLYHVHSSTVEVVDGSKSRRKFGTGGDYGTIAGGAIHDFESGSKIALGLSNTDSAGNITIRDLTIVITRL